MAAYHWLKERIISAEILPGSEISERQIAEQVGTSTVPVREALLLLAGHHLVSARNGTGYTVAPITVERADSALRLQAYLDAEASAEAAKRRDPLTGKHLGQLLAHVGPETGHTWDDPDCEAHYEFHCHIAQHADHPVLVQAVRQAHLESERIRRWLLRLGADVEHDVGMHHDLAVALDVGPTAARRAARQHAQQHHRQLMHHLRRHASAG
jgi:DNA-binding GntR family transcriptional regulator